MTDRKLKRKQDIVNNEINSNKTVKSQENILLQKPELYDTSNKNAIKLSLPIDTSLYEDFEFVPIKKKNNSKKHSGGIFKYALGILIIVVLVLGGSYSYFTYTKEDTRQADIYSGSVYVKIQEDAVNLTLNRMYPRTNEEARARNDNYIDFTLKGKNTSPTKEIGYALNIVNGADVSGKTRIDPQYLIIDLQEKVNDEYVYLVEAQPLSTFSYSDKVPVNTNDEITREFRFRIWVSDAIIVSDTESNATYTQAQFNNLYANVHVSVDAHDRKITIASCPNCVFRDSNVQKNIGDSLGTLGVDYYDSFGDMGNVFLGHVIDGNGIITENYLCGKKNNTPFCIRGGVNEASLTNKPVYETNGSVATTIFNSSICPNNSLHLCGNYCNNELEIVFSEDGNVSGVMNNESPYNQCIITNGISSCNNNTMEPCGPSGND